MKVTLALRSEYTRTVEAGQVTNRQIREALGLPLTGEITIGGLSLGDDELGEVFDVIRDISAQKILDGKRVRKGARR